ncbi:uncharacterized protein [Dermacentor albipictus]|uniref:uncharacterized protein isoform X2 n=1 Tax=Dermacentor albipictus TaxID=60249 RepID=UPI0038FC4EE5
METPVPATCGSPSVNIACALCRCGVNGHEGALASDGMSQFPETEASLHHIGCGTMQLEQHDKASDLPALTRCGWACRKAVRRLQCC